MSDLQTIQQRMDEPFLPVFGLRKKKAAVGTGNPANRKFIIGQAGLFVNTEGASAARVNRMMPKVVAKQVLFPS